MIAAEILMPSTVVGEWIEEQLSIEKILEVARTFGVSLAAAAIRCSELTRATAFEVSETSVTWGCGIVRKGRVDRLNAGLQSVIHNALKVRAGEEELLLDSEIGLRPWLAEYKSTIRGHVLVLLRPLQGNNKAESASVS
jgi:hypothetical protein